MEYFDFQFAFLDDYGYDEEEINHVKLNFLFQIYESNCSEVRLWALEKII